MYDWSTPAISQASVTIDSAMLPATATITNTFKRQLTALTITKAIAGGPAAGTTATFGFDIDCSASDDGHYAGSVALIN